VGGDAADPLTTTWYVVDMGNAFATHNLLAGATQDSLTQPLALGSHAVRISVRDGLGDPVSCDTSVKVQDTTAPVIAAHANMTAEATTASGAIVTYTSPSWTDAVAGSGTAGCVPASGSTFPVDTTTVTCTATDAAGNTGSASFTVTVTNLTTPGEMRGDGFVVKVGDRYHFTFDVSEGQRHAPRDRFRLRIDYDSRMGVDSKRKPKWTKPADDDFVATAITSIAFSDDPAFRPGHGRKPQVDTVQFSGTGKWNGRAGYAFDVLATDQGEPGRRRETVAITISNASGEVVASVSGKLAGGNIQSVRLKH